MKALAVVALLAAVPHESLPLGEWHAPGFVAIRARQATALRGHVRSPSHAASLRSAVDAADFEWRRHIMLPDWWEPASLRAVVVLAALRSGEVRMSRDRVSISGASTGSEVSLDALREVLPEGVELEVSVIDLRADDRDALCDRLFAALDLDAVLFESASSDIRPADYGRLNRLAAALRRCPSVRLAVNGHSDAFGSQSGNQFASEARAAAVRNFLVSRGVDGDRIEASGLGTTQPVGSNDTWAGRKLNRRVEIRRLD